MGMKYTVADGDLLKYLGFSGIQEWQNKGVIFTYDPSIHIDSTAGYVITLPTGWTDFPDWFYPYITYEKTPSEPDKKEEWI